MEQLILFLFKHWYLAIILVTLFYQIRNKWVHADKRTFKPQGMPSFGGSPGDASKPVERPKLAPSPKASPMQPIRQQSEYMRPGAEPAVASTNPKKKESPFGSTASIAPESALMPAESLSNPGLFPDQPTGQQILQGVIWSEILGPPRAKKPFRR
ncbi:hypothetical protein [Paenibacillus sp. SI8]|uniref:hypothetical protein n=1 Tax=unclassified Paenibacillus TaxID=185978 RepID=UPI003466FE7D